ncbi:MAG: NAD(P)H-dependent flavin oxidoreductase [Pyrinomonadaceae bacterium]
MVRTVLCDLLGIDVPIIQAPIGSATGPELVAAVSNAGGLGMLSVTWRTPDEMRKLLRETFSLTTRPFGINLVINNDVHDKLEICLEEGVKIVSLFWGEPGRYIETSHRAGAVVIHSAGSVAEARDAVEAGADIIVAQGWEAGGHVRGTVSTMVLVPTIADAIAPTPVIAAGGIADGRGIAAALALGASGAWLGTRFVASEEARAHEIYKQRLGSANAEDTAYSELFDVGWENAPHRALRNSTYKMWESSGSLPSGRRPNEGEAVAQRPDGTPVLRYSSSMPTDSMSGDVEALVMYAGQSVELVRETRPAAAIMEQLKTESERAFDTADGERQFLRHAISTLAYRAGKVLRDAPAGFASFKIGEASRTPAQILAHMGDLFDWALSMAIGEEKWSDSEPIAWDEGSARFFEALGKVDGHLASSLPLACSYGKIFQGPVADALTHVGQLAMLRRLAGNSVRGENYSRAEIIVGRVGPEQSPGRREFDRENETGPIIFKRKETRE